jgi:putative membrane protein
MDVLYRYVHFLGILLSAGILMAEVLLVKRKLNGFELRKLGLVDAAYGMSGIVLITGGLLLWFKGSKPSFFYTQNPVFLLKVSLVAVVGLTSIHPTVWFIRRRKVPDAEVVEVPPSVRFAVRAQLAVVLLLPLLAVLMARGVGLR